MYFCSSATVIHPFTWEWNWDFYSTLLCRDIHSYFHFRLVQIKYKWIQMKDSQQFAHFKSMNSTKAIRFGMLISHPQVKQRGNLMSLWINFVGRFFISLSSKHLLYSSLYWRRSYLSTVKHLCSVYTQQTFYFAPIRLICHSLLQSKSSREHFIRLLSFGLSVNSYFSTEIRYSRWKALQQPQDPIVVLHHQKIRVQSQEKLLS